MGPVFSILLWLILAGIYGFFWLLFLSLFIVGKIKKSRMLSWIGGIPLLLSTTFAVFTLCTIIWGIFSVSKPANVYEITFGTPPPADVTDIQSHDWYFADSGLTYLKFKASPTTIKKLTTKDWHQLSGKKLDEVNFVYMVNDDKPLWWHPRKTSSSQIYKGSLHSHDFATVDEMLIYNPKTQQAYYRFVGID